MIRRSDSRPSVATDDPERPSPAALAARDRLRARPRAPWHSRRGPERGLAYTLVVEHDLEQFADVRALVDVPWLLNERPAPGAPGTGSLAR